MNVLWFIVERFAECATIALEIFFFYRCLLPKKSRKTQAITCIMFFIIRIVYFMSGFPYRPYFAVLSGFIIMRIIFQGNARTHILWALLAVLIDGMIDTVILNAFAFIPDMIHKDTTAPGISRAMFIFCAKCLLFVSYFLTTINIEKSESIRPKTWILLMLSTIGSWIMLEALFWYNDVVEKDGSSVMAASGTISLLIIINVTIILYHQTLSDNKELARSKLQNRIHTMTQDHIEQMYSLYDQITRIKHDLKNHFLAILGYAQADDSSAIIDYVDSLVDFSAFEYIKHPVVDSIISTKRMLAEKNGIEFTSSVTLPDEMPITDVDLCVLFSNILDNAFEANVTAKTPRFIHLHAQIKDSYWIVVCRNAVRERGNLRTFGRLRSTKKTSGIHGIGTKQINDIAEGTGGFVSYRQENYVFTTIATITLSAESHGEKNYA